MNKPRLRHASLSTFHRNKMGVAVAIACLSLASESAMAASTTISTATTTQQVLSDTDQLTVTNTGSISTDDTNSASVYVTGDTGVTINNAGSISSGLSADIEYAAGIYISPALSGTITNSGSITAKSVTTTNVANAYGIYSGNLIATGSIANTGVISATSDASAGDARAYGIWFQGIVGVGSTVNNSGTISATATASSRAFANGVFYNSLNDGTFTNASTGHISATATSTSSYAVAVGVNAPSELGDGNTPSNGAITNQGTISATATSSSGSSAIAYGVAVGTNNGAITNSGTITATATSSAGSAFAYGVYVSTNNGGTITNSGTITATADDPSQGYSIYVDGGTGLIDNLQGGVLTGNLYAGGSVSVNNAGTIALQDGVSAYVGGDYTQASTGVLSIVASSTTSYSKLVVDGTATISGSAYVNVANLNTLSIGEILTGVVTASALVGNFSSVSDNSALFNFVSVVNGNSIDFDVVKGSSATSAVLSTGNNGGVGAAGAIDSSISANANGEIATLFLPLTTTQEVSDAVSQTTPSNTVNQIAAIQDVISGGNRTVQARLDGKNGQSTGDSFLADEHVWFKPFGSWANQNDRNGVSGYSAESYGLVFGVDGDLSEKNKVGVALSYAHTNVDSNSSAAPQSSRIDSYQLIGYGSHSLSDITTLSYQADIGQHDSDGSRSLLFTNSVASANYNSLSAHVGGALSRLYPLNEKTNFTPSVRADYTALRSDSYSETGAGALNLNVNSHTAQALIVGLDGKVNRTLNDKLTLTSNLGLGYDVLNEQASITSSFAGFPSASFVTNGLNQSPWLARGGIGLVNQANERVQISARYDFEVRNHFDNQTASVRVRWAF